MVVGEELDKYWTLKKRMAAGAAAARRGMLAALKRAGAAHGAAVWAGGGFLVVATKEPDDRAGVRGAGRPGGRVAARACRPGRSSLARALP